MIRIFIAILVGAGLMVAATLFLRTSGSYEALGPACAYPELEVGPIRPYDSCVPAILADKRFTWNELRSEHFILHYTAGSEAATNTREFLDLAELARKDNLALLGNTDYPHTVHLFFTGSREEYERVSDAVGEAWAIAHAQTILFLLPKGDRESAMHHELNHVFAITLWGLNRIEDYWLREGLAVYASDALTPGKVDSTARVILADGRGRPMVEYQAHFFGRDDNLPAYMLSGSFVKFLVESRGMDRLRSLWQAGTESFASVYNASVDSLEAEWKARLMKTKA